jgi:hypothetical protein
MKVFFTITMLLLSTLLFAQPKEGGTTSGSYEDEGSKRRRARISDLQFDRVDYFYKDNILQYAIQHNVGNGFPRTWRYFSHKEGSDEIINQLKTKYPNKQFHGATQTVFRNKVSYEIIMEDKKRWYVYQTDTLGVMQLKKKFRKRY